MKNKTLNVYVAILFQSLYTNLYENQIQFLVNLTAILYKSNPVKENYHQAQTKDKSTTGKSYQLIYLQINVIKV